MKLLEKIKNTLLIDDEAAKEESIEDIGDSLEYGDFDRPEIIEGVNLLLSHIPMVKNDTVKESMLHAIHNGIVYQDIASEISLDLLLPYLSTFNEEHLTYVLTFLGFSGESKYGQILKTFIHHSSEEIRNTAEEAIIELEYRCSNAK
ncbi:hypothetical protein [Rossellomorea marisflavi]|uniref:hypothetical protein n=1 Tax=Rossellomorea marisflavi TaxID=189381 RepID=UPI0009A90948|nr:hypothetical protein [Rossellomorea marisflavi]